MSALPSTPHNRSQVTCAASFAASSTLSSSSSPGSSRTQHKRLDKLIKKKKVVRAPRLVPIAAATAEATTSAPSFYAEEGTSFSSLGLQLVEEALQEAGFERPSSIQSLSVPAILRGQNTVITAETGSGKTLSYVAPISALMVRQRAALAKQQAELEATGAEQDEATKLRRYHALVLCPNAALCQQVIAVAQSLKGADGKPLATAAQVNSSNPPPFDTPDIIVATPAGLMTLIRQARGAYGWLWTEEGLQARVRHLVLDEADLLLSKAYLDATQAILTLLKVGDRRRVEARLLPELGLTQEEYARLPRPLQHAGWRGGVPGMLAEGYRPKTHLDPNQAYGPYWRRQYVFVAATMPAITTSDVGTLIQRSFPDATWLSSELLHTSTPRVSHTWHEVDDASFGSTLLDVLQGPSRNQPGSSRPPSKDKVLVFTADGASADRASELLAGARVAHVVYHSNRPVKERTEALEALRSTPGTIMVCTDAAARGLDVADVAHVVQADFAANTIDFIHRIGRTARAGRTGKVTSLYRLQNKALVEVLRSYIEQGVPMEAAFSRARSFSKKMKKAGGKFVPRGAGALSQEGQEAAQGKPGAVAA